MYRHQKVGRTLNKIFMTPFLKKAQIAEFRELRSIITETCAETKRPLNILDIGIGDGRIPRLLAREKTWGKIKLYVGIENSRTSIRKCREALAAIGIENKTRIFYFDAADLGVRDSSAIFKYSYDLIICTYFTAGNFKPDEISMIAGKDGFIRPYPQSSLEPNRKFVGIFKAAHRLLSEKGRIVLGTTYIDTDANRIRQEDFYRKCGMTIITSKSDSFTATKEGFWSQRFTRKRIRDYFSWHDEKKIELRPLDGHDFARMVIIGK